MSPAASPSVICVTPPELAPTVTVRDTCRPSTSWYTCAWAPL
ncbi:MULTISPECIES: hypothetical protein [Protofrankia]|nr:MULTISPECIES: hypothetical protein [Protofrankia]